MRLSAKRREEVPLSTQLPLARRSVLRIQERQVDILRLGRGEPLVLVPGLAGGWKLLAPLARVLARCHEVILFGLRGDRQWLGSPPPRSIGDLADDLGHLIRGLRLERPTVLGVSFGGAVALEFAAEHPDAVGALVLHGAESRFRAATAASIARRVLERFPLPDDNPFLNQFFNLLHAGKPEPGPLVDFIVERCWQTDQSVIARRLALLESFDVIDRLWQIEAPTLVVAGGRDAIVGPRRQKALADGIAGAQFEVIEGAGHVGFLTHRDELARHVARFARTCRGATI